MPDNMEIFTVEGIKMLKCPKCDEMSKRRYNIDRHYKRFHKKTMPPKACCGIKFCTKSDFYKHKENVHKEKKKYSKGQDGERRRQDQESPKFCKIKIEESQETVIETFVDVSEIKNNEISQSSNEKIDAPKKYFLYKWNRNSSSQLQLEENTRTPLTNINNISKRTAMKHALRITKLSNSSNIEKENVKIYNITDRSDIDKELYSIDF